MTPTELVNQFTDEECRIPVTGLASAAFEEDGKLDLEREIDGGDFVEFFGDRFHLVVDRKNL